jgi:DNA transposition AAA+ family ATPase
MKKGFVHTENYKRLAEAQKTVSRRGAPEAGLVIIQGVYGVGKSELTERWAVDNGAIFVRGKETWTKRALLDELADVMGVDKRGRNQEVQARIIGKLAVSLTPLIFDEADHLVRTSASLLEVIRDITDVTGVMCFLVGMEHFSKKVDRYPHIASRVARRVEFQPLSLGDVTAACTQMSEVALAPDAVSLVHEQCKGRMRHVLNAIAAIEHLAKANAWKQVTAEQLKGRQLVNEFSANPLARRLGAPA